jgi:hypothetical protein
VHLIRQTEVTKHSPERCHGIVIVLYNVRAASSTVIRDDWLLIGDHLSSPAEPSHAYHRNAVVFAAANSSLTLHWESPSRLVATCNGSYEDHIDVLKRPERGGEYFLRAFSPSLCKYRGRAMPQVSMRHKDRRRMRQFRPDYRQCGSNPFLGWGTVGEYSSMWNALRR